jgi:hypothetical protein
VDTLLDEFPRDLVALKVSQFVLSYLGESNGMRERVARVLPSWSPNEPGYGFVLGCHAYALEESGDYRQAEETGRAPWSSTARDIWAAHAVAHVAEMEGRLEDGIAWIADLADEWHECSNFALTPQVARRACLTSSSSSTIACSRYTTARCAPSRRTSTSTVANAVSLLWRLEQADVNVGAAVARAGRARGVARR